MRGNLYEELSLSRELSTEEIKNELSCLERIWHQREIMQPEKAHKMLAILDNARVVFTTDESREQYDAELERELFSNDSPNDTKKIEYEKWYGTAVDYFNKEQYDLAKTAIEKALTFYNSETNNDAFLSYAADIYRFNNDYDSALRFINEAIIINPTNWVHHVLKGIILSGLERYQETYDSYAKALDIARGQADSSGIGTAQGLIANVLYNHSTNLEAAEAAAQEAIQNGDPSGRGKKVADLIAEKRQKEIKAHETTDTMDFYSICSNPVATYRERCDLLDVIESAFIKVFLRADVQLYPEAYALRRQYGGLTLEEDERVYNWGLDGSGSFNLHLIGTPNDRIDHISFVTTYEGSRELLPMIQRKISETLSQLQGRGVVVKKGTYPNWIQSGKCRYCGGTFSGLFTKKCSACGHEKDY